MIIIFLEHMFNKFMKSGEEIKKELQKLIENGKLKSASNQINNSLKDVANFIKLFKISSKYHTQLQNVITELNALNQKINSNSDVNEIKKNINKPLENNIPDKIENEKVRPTSEVKNDIVMKMQGEQDSPIEPEKKYSKTKILADEIREKATKIAETEMNFNDFPKSSYGFEKAYNSTKKRPDVFFNYLKFFGPNNIPVIYKNSEISYGLLIYILQSLKKYGLENSENFEISLEYLKNIPKTKNFTLIKKFFKKSDIENVKNFIDDIHTYDASTKEFNLDKLYL